MAITCDICGKNDAEHYFIQMMKGAGIIAQATDQHFRIDLCEEHAKFSKEEFVKVKNADSTDWFDTK